MHRVFVAIPVPAPLAAPLLAMMSGVGGARWQTAEQLHITLRFIGDVDRRLLDDIAVALSNVRARGFAVALDGVGRFASGTRIEALWAGLTPRDALTRLHHKVDTALVRLGLPPERRAYLPHVTLARFSRSATVSGVDQFLAGNAGLSSRPTQLGHFCLMESQLGRSGASYEAIARYPLV